MRSIIRAAEVPLQEAARLADLYGIVHDLDTAKEWCEKTLVESPQSYGDPWINEALVTAAIVKYCRCFVSGVRFGLHLEDIQSIGPELLDQHKYFKALRDKFIAHPVNPFDESYVMISIREDGGCLSLHKNLHSGNARLMLSEQEAEELLTLIAAVKLCVNDIVELEKSRLLEVIAGLPEEEWKGWDLYSPKSIDRADVSKSRKRGALKD